jgi:hypothetical protein
MPKKSYSDKLTKRWHEKQDELKAKAAASVREFEQGCKRMKRVAYYIPRLLRYF